MARRTGGPGIERLLEFGGRDDLTELLERDAGTLAGVVRTAPEVPPALVDAVFAAGDEWIGALARNSEAVAASAALRMRLAGTGHPLVARAVFESLWPWRAHEMRVLLAAADPADPAWKARLGRIRKLIAEYTTGQRDGEPHTLRAAVAAPFPRLVRSALSTDGILGRADVLRGLLALHDHGGPAQLRAALGDPATDRELRRHGCADLAARLLAGPDGAAELRAAVAEAEGTPGGTAEDYLNPWRDLDWTALLAAHAKRPLPPGMVETLVERADCPDEAFAPLGASHPEPDVLLARLERPAPPGLLGALRADGLRVDTLIAVVDRGLGRTFTGADLLHRVRPARVVLETAQGLRAPEEPARREWQAFRAGLAELVAERLGSDAAAWRALRAALAEFPGSIGELVEEAVARAAGGEAAVGAPWPDAQEMPTLTGPWRVLKGERAAFVELLNAAATPVQRQLLRHVDDQTASDLLALGEWRPEWLDWARESGPGGRERVLVARHQLEQQVVSRNRMATSLPRRLLPAEAAAELAALDDPAVNAALIYQPLLPRPLRDAVLTGRRLRPGPADRLPLDADLRAELVDPPTSWTDLLPAFGTGDPELTAHCIQSGWADRSPALQLRIVLGLWERNGTAPLREEPRRWLPGSFDEKVRALVAELLAEEDESAALDRLRAAVADAESTRGLLERFRTSGSDFYLIQTEGFVLEWDELYAAFQRGALDPGRAGELVGDDLCPERLAGRPWVRLSRAQRTAVRDLAGGRPAAEVLAATPLTVRGGQSWVEEALRAGLLTPADVVRHARPAGAALTAVPLDAPARREVADLVREHLAGRPDAWALVTHLAADFTGALPELLRTAAQAVE
ncbi:hypothetical protein [Marinitenerispora sediminis]|uniref:Uncharacterized protein n=1 Tax=Marinitenerispora sediminis TaxID=1931232 RepID=A0A368T022_9ACTN|nr:hypothetical protein [Marinitenerispora sediminis]RCV49490.1 hypothetical protein DEF23_23520 [Marinitenerispora sediminis]RCV52173.1 hypothetical protein DEF24_22350 [Marinitenerispora sediminis]RCV53747.1 hypothetical protein DEF28_09880 [Marinitenerispora sediminis]